MQNLINNTMQLASGNPVSQMYSENVSISHHMSEALRESFYRVLTLFIAVLARNP